MNQIIRRERDRQRVRAGRQNRARRRSIVKLPRHIGASKAGGGVELGRTQPGAVVDRHRIRPVNHRGSYRHQVGEPGGRELIAVGVGWAHGILAQHTVDVKRSGQLGFARDIRVGIVINRERFAGLVGGAQLVMGPTRLVGGIIKRNPIRRVQDVRQRLGGLGGKRGRAQVQKHIGGHEIAPLQSPHHQCGVAGDIRVKRQRLGRGQVRAAQNRDALQRIRLHGGQREQTVELTQRRRHLHQGSGRGQTAPGGRARPIDRDAGRGVLNEKLGVSAVSQVGPGGHHPFSGEDRVRVGGGEINRIQQRTEITNGHQLGEIVGHRQSHGGVRVGHLPERTIHRQAGGGELPASGGKGHQREGIAHRRDITVVQGNIERPAQRGPAGQAQVTIVGRTADAKTQRAVGEIIAPGQTHRPARHRQRAAQLVERHPAGKQRLIGAGTPRFEKGTVVVELHRIITKRVIDRLVALRVPQPIIVNNSAITPPANGSARPRHRAVVHHHRAADVIIARAPRHDQCAVRGNGHRIGAIPYARLPVQRAIDHIGPHQVPAILD